MHYKIILVDIIKVPIQPFPITLVGCMHLILHNKMQTQILTTSKGHVATNFFAEYVELSLQLPTQSHTPQFPQQSHTRRKK